MSEVEETRKVRIKSPNDLKLEMLATEVQRVEGYVALRVKWGTTSLTTEVPHAIKDEFLAVLSSAGYTVKSGGSAHGKFEIEISWG